MSASLIGRLGSSTFRLSTNSSVDVAHGLALLFGLGTKALPSWDSKTRWNNLMGDLAVTVTAGSSRHTNSPHPSSRAGHHSTVGWISCLLRFDLIFSVSPIGRLVSSPSLPVALPICRCRSRARASLRTRHQGPSIMGFEDEVEQSYGRPCRHCNGRFKPTYELTSSIVPRGTSFHRWVDLRSSPI